jgi:hypothetical protein
MLYDSMVSRITKAGVDAGGQPNRSAPGRL